METLLKAFDEKLKTQKIFEGSFPNTAKLVNYILTNKDVDSVGVERFIHANKSEIKSLFKSILSIKKNYPNSDIFFKLGLFAKDVIDEYVKENPDFKQECYYFKPLFSLYYSTLDYMYRDAIMEYEKSKRKHFQYPIEAYDYKENNDSKPLKDNAYYACFH